MPALVKYGTYSVLPKKLNIKLFYDTEAISSFYGKAVMYIGYIGRIKNEHIFKYGLSRKMFERDHDQHSKFFKQFDVIYIGETDNCELIEKLFEHDLKIFRLHRQHTVKNKSITELFTISTKYSVEYLIDHLKSLIENNKLPAIQDADNKIANLNAAIKFYKQSDEIKKLELQFKLSDNYKLELENFKLALERDIAVKQLDMTIKRLDMTIKQLDLQIEREKNKSTIAKGHDHHSFDYDDYINKAIPKKKSAIIKL